MSKETDENPNPRPRRQQQRSIATQNKLLDAAIAAFSENGFKATSTRDIAERAGVHHPLITYHFKNKDQLWRAAADRVFHNFRDSLAASLQDNTGVGAKQRMATLIRAYVYYARRQPALHRVLVHEASSPNPRLDWLIETHLKPFFETTFTMIEELQHIGVARPGNPRLLFNMIRLSTGGLLALGHELQASSGIDVEADETLDEIVEIVVNVFFPGEITSSGA
ncbi:MAG: TetR/AcrR family transcriptional regulator [Woeseiaceae bacterium]|nr:TetR/AcrR family transcriptional regulator [Woeseiaceae bacterium]